MAVFSLAAIDPILVQHLEDTYETIWLQNRPFFDRIVKKNNVGGSAVRVPLPTSPGGGTGGDFTSALANSEATGSKRIAFVVLPALTYGIERVPNADIPFSDTPESAIDILTEATRNAMELAATNLEAIIFSDGFGTLGTILTAVNTAGSTWTLTLTDPAAVFKFNLGYILVQKATPAAAALQAGTAEVTGANPMGGTIFVTVTGMTPTAGMVLGIQGQMIASTSPSTFPGIFGWIPPITARTLGVPGDTFLGVTRTAASNVPLVAGFAADGRSSGSIVQSINNLAAMMSNYKMSKPDVGICNPLTLAQVCNELGTQARNDYKSADNLEVLYSGITIMTPAGPIDLLAESACPSDQIVLTKGNQWIFSAPDKPFKPSSPTGLMVPDYSNDQTRLSITASGFFYTLNPAATGVLTVS